eukprot:m.329970 g.329970  ORF g.329970 m.329970 type:complete len:271 (+) comp20455_c0_seq1:363-1175(+)
MAAPRLMDGKLNSKMETLLLEVQIDQKKKQAAGMESDIKALEAMIQNKKTSFEGLQERLTAMRSVLNKVQNIEPEVGLEDYVANIMEQISLCKTAETEWSESFDSGMSSLQDNVKKWSEQKTKLESDNEALGAECWSLKEALVVGEQRRQRIDSEQAMAVEQARLAGLLSQTVLPHLPKTARRSLAHVGNPAIAMCPAPNGTTPSGTTPNGTTRSGTTLSSETTTTPAAATPPAEHTSPPPAERTTVGVEVPTMPTYGLESTPTDAADVH